MLLQKVLSQAPTPPSRVCPKKKKKKSWIFYVCVRCAQKLSILLNKFLSFAPCRSSERSRLLTIFAPSDVQIFMSGRRRNVLSASFQLYLAIHGKLIWNQQRSHTKLNAICFSINGRPGACWCFLHSPVAFLWELPFEVGRKNEMENESFVETFAAQSERRRSNNDPSNVWKKSDWREQSVFTIFSLLSSPFTYLFNHVFPSIHSASRQNKKKGERTNELIKLPFIR